MSLLKHCLVACALLAALADGVSARPRNKQAKAIEKLLLAGKFSEAATRGQAACERQPRRNSESCILAAISAYRMRQWTNSELLLDAAKQGASPAQLEYLETLRAIVRSESIVDSGMSHIQDRVTAQTLDEHAAAVEYESIWSSHQSSEAPAIAAIDKYVAARDYPAALALYERARWTIGGDGDELAQHAKAAEIAMAQVYEHSSIHLLGEGLPLSLVATLENVATAGAKVRDIELGVGGRWTLITSTHLHWSSNAPADLITLINKDDRPAIVDISLGSEEQWVAVLADGTIQGFAWTPLIERSRTIESSDNKITAVDIGQGGTYTLVVAGDAPLAMSSLPEASLKSLKDQGCDGEGVKISTFGNGNFVCIRSQGGIEGYRLPRGVARLVDKLPAPLSTTFSVDGRAWAVLY